MTDSLQEFEDQLQQEALATERENVELTADEFTVGGVLYRKDPDGTVFEFDPEKRAWFPKIDEDFIAQYQMNYGSNETTSEAASSAAAAPVSYPDDYWTNPPADVNSEEYRVWYEHYCNYFYPQNAAGDANSTTESGNAEQNDDTEVDAAAEADAAKLSQVAAESGSTADNAVAGKKRKKAKKDGTQPAKPAEPPAWFEVEEEKNCNVYVSGLPEDITQDEYKEFMTKVGVIAYDPIFRKPKLKLYANADGSYKGDGRCCYIKSESVDLALQILDGSDIRGHRVSVERAHFELKGEYDPTKKRRKLTKQEKKKFKEKQEKILGWQPEKPPDTRPRHDRVVVIKHAFLPDLFEKDPMQINEVSADFREECNKYGDVRKVTVYDRHADGVVTIAFRSPEEADQCIAAVHGRWFDGRTLHAEHWDGHTKYMIQESQEEMEKRLNKWHSFIEEASNKSADDASNSGGGPETKKDEGGKTEGAKDGSIHAFAAVVESKTLNEGSADSISAIAENPD